ncbi:hypothetical protein NPJ88_001085 [Halomonas elongata]|uniref:DUF6575 domain-containing protein n=1 Tax=Halomonas elongata TaxID=2746 RepID=UPI00255B39FE|nr:DUF6575 domain-containing protein [Halomonas elongata]MDL4860920.1 hypothetical protein [Halomonas elongata]
MLDSPLPKGFIDPLGTLRLVTVYEYFDFPRLFLSRNETGQHYLCACVEDELTDDFEDLSRWLCAPVSLERIRLIESDCVQLREGFSKVEGGHCYSLSLLDGEVESVNRVGCEVLPDEDLPEEGVFLEYEGEGVDHSFDPQQKAIAYEADVVNVRLRSPRILGMDVPLQILSNFSGKLQELMNVIAHYNSGFEGEKGRISEAVVEDSELLFSGAFQGSFGAQIVSKKKRDLVDSHVSSTLYEFASLVKAGGDEDKLSLLMSAYNQRVASKYLAFLKVVKANELSTSFDWASSGSKELVSFSLDCFQADAAIKFVSKIEESLSKVIKVRAELTGWTHGSAKFEAKTPGSEYKGSIHEDLLGIQTEPTIYAYYDMEIEESEESRLTGESQKTYTLRSLERLDR